MGLRRFRLESKLVHEQTFRLGARSNLSTIQAKTQTDVVARKL